jgi:hypothetical protein
MSKFVVIAEGIRKRVVVEADNSRHAHEQGKVIFGLDNTLSVIPAEEQPVPEWLQKLREKHHNAAEYEVAELQYVTPKNGDHFKLYLYGPDGYHSGGQWFTSSQIRYPDEEISAESAKQRTDENITNGFEVRICDGGDMLVAHWNGGRQLYPAPHIDFWSQI